MHKRWYDIDPTVSLSVSLIRNADINSQLQCAEYIINYAQEREFQLKNNALNGAFNYILRRWYDQNVQVAEAFDYFENFPLENQKEVALELINILQFA